MAVGVGVFVGVPVLVGMDVFVGVGVSVVVPLSVLVGVAVAVCVVMGVLVGVFVGPAVAATSSAKDKGRKALKGELVVSCKLEAVAEKIIRPETKTNRTARMSNKIGLLGLFFMGLLHLYAIRHPYSMDFRQI